MNPKIVFLGNTKYSVIGAEIINKSFPLSVVITKPSTPPIEWAIKNNVQYLETVSMDQEIIQEISKVEPDFLIVEDFGLILPQEMLEIAKIDNLNIHHSLLPKYRGPSPAPFAILNGDKETGVSVISMVEEVDAGDVLGQVKYQMKGDETTDSLLTILNELGGELMVEVLKQFQENKVKRTPQDPSQVILTKRFTKDDGFFEIGSPPDPEILDRMIRAYHPWPGVWTKWNGKIVKFLPEEMVQMEGKKATKLQSFLNGYPDFPLKNL